jgi:Cu/Ag efflux protein CusF
MRNVIVGVMMGACLVGMPLVVQASEEASQQGHEMHEGMEHASSPAVQEEQEEGGEADGVGTVNAIDSDKRVINISHAPIPDLKWPAMTMDMPVTKRVDLENVKVGDSVAFTVKMGRDKVYRIVSMLPGSSDAPAEGTEEAPAASPSHMQH